MFVDLKGSFEKEIVDSDKYFKVAYSTAIGQYLLIPSVSWIASYNRYYKITEEDYNLYVNNKEAFYEKFAVEIAQRTENCFNENFIGSDALRDYDGANGFQQAGKPKDGGNPFQHYKLVDGILFARIVWEHEEIYVPPVQAIRNPNGSYSFPLREKCEPHRDAYNRAICNKLKKEFY